jgi:hypothetical protein
LRRDTAIAAVFKLCRGESGFKNDTASLIKEIGEPNVGGLIESLLECGVIPESFGHDSSEEKLYAKYCDVLLSFAFNRIGIKSVVIEERADSADVVGESEHYSIVGDAKAFRLSRTAKNQKDFKVAALSSWRGKNKHACLVCPIYQYPSDRSQIYEQAVEFGVTLLGYIHLTFLVEHSRKAIVNLSKIWEVGKTIPPTNKAAAYWKAVDNSVCDAVGKTEKDLEQFKKREHEVLEKIKVVEIKYLESRIAEIRKLTHVEAIKALITETNFPSRIEQIKRTGY